MTPAPELLAVTKAMIENIWEARLNDAKQAKAEITHKLKVLDKKITKVVDRLVQATSDTIVAAYERELQKLEHEKRLLKEQQAGVLEPQKSFEESFKLAMALAANPWILCEKGGFGHKRLLLRLAIPRTLTYHTKNGFLNPELSLPFKLLGGVNMQKKHMVRTAGLEPARGYPRQILSLLCLPIPPRPP